MFTIQELQKRLKKYNNLSELSRRTGLTRSYLSAIANGNRVNPSYQTIAKIAECLEVENG